eukprot:835221-Prorocentrum_minimum.AAC.8
MTAASDSKFSFPKGVQISKQDGLVFLREIPNNSVDLVLTDPPYLISELDTGRDRVYRKTTSMAGKVRTETQWEQYKKSQLGMDKSKRVKMDLNETAKRNYMQFGTVYGKKFCKSTDYGEWDHQKQKQKQKQTKDSTGTGLGFDFAQLQEFIRLYYEKLRTGGTLILFTDLWKIGEVRDFMTKVGFCQVRFVEWVKTNPQPIMATTYMTNAREAALLAVKGGGPCFNGPRLHRGVFYYPNVSHAWYKAHPTQKNLQLFEELVRFHTNEGDLVMDTFLGGGTTALAAHRTGRRFVGCEKSGQYFAKYKGLFALSSEKRSK